MNKLNRTVIIVCSALFFMVFCQPVGVFAASSQTAGNWNTILAKAKEEGKLVISTSNTPPVRQARPPPIHKP